MFGSKLKRKKCIFLSFSLFSFFLKIYKWKWTEEIEELDTKPREKKKKASAVARRPWIGWNRTNIDLYPKQIAYH